MDYSFKKDLGYCKELLEYSAEEFAHMIGISRATYNRWQKDNFIPDTNALERIYSAIYDKGINLNRIYEELYLSQETADTRILMHGSKSDITENPSVKYSESKKDFGQGFYLGESVRQAISFVSGYKESSIYFFKLEGLSKLKTVTYDVSKEWMVMVAYFRGKIDKYKNCRLIQNELEKIKGADMVIAPIADNTMYSIINEFVEGSITDEQCANSLSANRLGKQYVFLNDDVLTNNLTMLRKGYICAKEKKTTEAAREEESTIGKSKVILAKRRYAGKGKYIEELLI